MAAIFHMAWFTMPLHAHLVDEWLLRGLILAHIPLPRSEISTQGVNSFYSNHCLIHLTIRALGVMRSHCLLFVPSHCATPPTHYCHTRITQIYSQQGWLIIAARWGLLPPILPRQQWTLQMWVRDERCDFPLSNLCFVFKNWCCEWYVQVQYLLKSCIYIQLCLVQHMFPSFNSGCISGDQCPIHS